MQAGLGEILVLEGNKLVCLTAGIRNVLLHSGRFRYRHAVSEFL